MAAYDMTYQQYKQAAEDALRALKIFQDAMPEGKPVTDACERPPRDGVIPQPLRSAMVYSLWQPSKRLRPVLLLASCAMLKSDWSSVLPYACAIEMIHTYSLIHDDLPALDNDDLRRGAPTSHKAFGENIAILAGDALQSAAFETMLDAAMQSHDPKTAIRAVNAIARHAGVGGMIAGQTLDVKLEGEAPQKPLVEYIHRHKTADMIIGAVTAGLILAGATDEQVASGYAYAENLGVAFQIVDDLLDVFGDSKVLGKTIGKDAQQGKMTWPSVVGVEQSREDARSAVKRAVDALAPFGDKAEFLRQVAQQTLVRTK